MLPTPQQARTPRRFRSLDAEDIRARANELLDGEKDSFFNVNPWERVRAIDVSSQVFPLGVEVVAVDVTIGASLVGGSRIGLTWDDASVLELPPQQVNAGQVLALRVEARRGQRLEVWADDAEEIGAVSVVAAARLEERAEQREREKKAAEDKDDPVTAATKEAAATAKLAIVGGIVLVVVVALAIANKWNGAIPSPSIGA